MLQSHESTRTSSETQAPASKNADSRAYSSTSTAVSSTTIAGTRTHPQNASAFPLSPALLDLPEKQMLMILRKLFAASSEDRRTQKNIWQWSAIYKAICQLPSSELSRVDAVKVVCTLLEEQQINYLRSRSSVAEKTIYPTDATSRLGSAFIEKSTKALEQLPVPTDDELLPWGSNFIARVQELREFLHILHLDFTCEEEDVQQRTRDFIDVAAHAQMTIKDSVKETLEKSVRDCKHVRGYQRECINKFLEVDFSQGLTTLLFAPGRRVKSPSVDDEEQVIREVTQVRRALATDMIPPALAKDSKLALANVDVLWTEWNNVQEENAKKKAEKEYELEQRRRKVEEENSQRREKSRTAIGYILEMDALRKKKFRKGDINYENPFFLLGIPPDLATEEIIKNAKKNLAILTHPDKVNISVRDGGAEAHSIRMRSTEAFKLVVTGVNQALKAVHEMKHRFYSPPERYPPYAADIGLQIPSSDESMAPPVKSYRVGKENVAATANRPQTRGARRCSVCKGDDHTKNGCPFRGL